MRFTNYETGLPPTSTKKENREQKEILSKIFFV